MINEHLVTCNCYDCLEQETMNSVDTLIGKFIKSSKPVNVYKVPGGNLKRTVKPNGFVGRVESTNEKQTWVRLPDSTGGGWVFVSKDLKFNEAKPIPPLTKDQKIDIALGVMKKMPGGEVVTAAETVAEGAKKILSFGPYIKWIIAAAVVAILLGLFLRFKG